ncbi:MAG: hypothetical protein RL013_980 [Bacteroidota bacterium]|jgi:hypothetical protein
MLRNTVFALSVGDIYPFPVVFEAVFCDPVVTFAR